MRDLRYIDEPLEFEIIEPPTDQEIDNEFKIITGYSYDFNDKMKYARTAAKWILKRLGL